MGREVRTLTRRELYDLVWSKPMMKLAEEFGLSDRGLAKTCERHRVPVPPRGYWAKLAAGKKVKQTYFVEVDDPRLNRIDITSSVSNLPEATRELLERSKAQRAERAKTRKVQDRAPVVPLEPVGKPHKFLAATARALRKSKPDQCGAVHASGTGCCGVSVHAERAERLLAILDHLFREFDARGMGIEPRGDRVQLNLGQDSITFTLREKTRRENHEPTERELAKYETEKKRRALRGWPVDLPYRWNKPWPEFDTVYTGQLAFSIDGWGEGLRRTWADGKMQTVESLMDQIGSGVEAMLSFNKARREQREEDQRRYRELERRRELHKQRKAREEKRLALLSEIMETQRQASELRDWLRGPLPEAEGETELTRMMDWARQRLSELEGALTPQAISAALDGAELFPEEDALYDPLGDPAESYGYSWR